MICLFNNNNLFGNALLGWKTFSVGFFFQKKKMAPEKLEIVYLENIGKGFNKIRIELKKYFILTLNFFLQNFFHKNIEIKSINIFSQKRS